MHSTINSVFKSAAAVACSLLMVAMLALVGCSTSSPVANPSNSGTESATMENSDPEKKRSTKSGIATDASSQQVVFGKPIVERVPGAVSKVLDGDTIKVKTEDGQELTVRMECIDAPEGKARYADLVLQRVTALLDGKSCELLVTGKDGRGRTLAFVLVDGVNMNADMIEQGLVKHFTKYSKSQELADLESKAKEQFLNIWSAGKPAPDGDAGKLKAPLSIFFWNVESDGADTNVIAQQLPEFSGHAIYGLTEVPEAAFETYREALGEGFKSIQGTHFKEDHLQLIYDDTQVELLSWNEVDEIGDIQMNKFPRVQRSPLLARFKQRDGGVEFYIVVNHLARGSAEFRQQQATGLREWARNRQMPIIAIGDYNFDYEFDTDRGNKAFSNFMQDNVWKWIKPVELIDTNWYDREGDGEDDFPGSMLDFAFVAGAAKAQDWQCEVIVREGDFPDDETTSDHRPSVLTLVSDGATHSQ